MRRKKSSPIPMHSLLAEIVSRKKWQGRFELHQVFERWQSLVGREISRHAVPQRFQGRVLWVDVSDSVWHQQLQFLKNDLLTKLNNSLHKEKVEDIRFQLKDGLAAELAPRPEKQWTRSTPSEAEIAAMERHLRDVEDEELRLAMKRCWYDFYGLPR